MDGTSFGNAQNLPPERRGWLLGRFIEEDPLRLTNDVEIKWGIHQAGESNDGFAANKTAKTVSIVIEGRFRLQFRTADGSETDERLLAEVGDFAVWEAGVFHNWVAETDCKILTVRWPSVADDQVQLNGA